MLTLDYLLSNFSMVLAVIFGILTVALLVGIIISCVFTVKSRKKLREHLKTRPEIIEVFLPTAIEQVDLKPSAEIKIKVQGVSDVEKKILIDYPIREIIVGNPNVDMKIVPKISIFKANALEVGSVDTLEKSHLADVNITQTNLDNAPARVVYVERIVEVPVEKIVSVEKIIEKEVEVEKLVEKTVEVEKVVERQYVDESALNAKEEELRQRQEEIARLSMLVSSAGEREAYIKAKMKELESQREMYDEETFRQKEQELKRSQDEIYRLKVLVDSAEERETFIRERMAELETQIEGYQNEIENYQKEIEKTKNDAEKYKMEIDNYRNQLNDLNSALEKNLAIEKHGNISDAEMAIVRAEIIKQRALIDQYQKELGEKEVELSDCYKQIEDSKEEITRLRALTETAVMAGEETVKSLEGEDADKQVDDGSKSKDEIERMQLLLAALERQNGGIKSDDSANDDTDENIDDVSDAIDIKDINLSTGTVTVVKYDKSFNAKLIQFDDVVKERYCEIKNHLQSYAKVSTRLSWAAESFNYSRERLARLVLRGKTLNIFLALDPKEYAPTRGNGLKDVSNVKKYAGTPVKISLTSDRKIKQAKKFIDEVMNNYSVAFAIESSACKPSDFPYEPTAALVEKGLIKEILQEESLQDVATEMEALAKNKFMKSISAEVAHDVMSDEDANKLIGLKQIKFFSYNGRKNDVYIDDISKNFEANEIITIEKLFEKKILSDNTQRIKVKARGTIDKPLTVIAEEFEADAVKMIILTGGSAEKRWKFQEYSEFNAQQRKEKNIKHLGGNSSEKHREVAADLLGSNTNENTTINDTKNDTYNEVGKLNENQVSSEIIASDSSKLSKEEKKSLKKQTKVAKKEAKVAAKLAKIAKKNKEKQEKMEAQELAKIQAIDNSNNLNSEDND